MTAVLTYAAISLVGLVVIVWLERHLNRQRGVSRTWLNEYWHRSERN